MSPADVFLCIPTHSQSFCSPSDALEEAKADNRSSGNLLILQTRSDNLPDFFQRWSKNKTAREKKRETNTCVMDLGLSGEKRNIDDVAVFAVSTRRRFSGFTVRKSHRGRQRQDEALQRDDESTSSSQSVTSRPSCQSHFKLNAETHLDHYRVLSVAAYPF